jgi:FAD/FMN-containing dehydrogenase
MRAALTILGAVRELRHAPLMAFEYFEEACLQAVLAHGHGPSPFAQAHPAYVLIELDSTSTAAVDEIEAFIAAQLDAGLVRDGVLAQSGKDAAALWGLRENISESLSRTGFLHKNDISVPVPHLADFVDAMRAELRAAYPHYQVYVFGHLGDGNLHINVIKPDDLSRAAFDATCHHADEILFGIVRGHGGSISAEHGIGLLKKAFLGFRRSEAELALQRGIKAVLDPKGLLNPGKVLDP